MSRVARLLWHFVVLEVRLYGALGRWVARRPAVPAGATAWGYSRLVTPVMWLWIFGSACEVPLAHVLVPWPGVRLALLVLGIWGLVWMIGMLASLKVYPHVADDDALTIRYGVFAALRVPWSAVAAVRYDDRDVEGFVRVLRPRATPAGTEVLVPVNDRVNVLLELAVPLAVRTSRGEVRAVALGIWADEPRELVAALREVVGTPA
ncbi:hypothetical protein [Nocardioides sp. LML1-1-1.1]|uniref:hypothetical protein n=1 Tax=Nocardioides sp. LML1-1-1.1 TaxID=3135248 RepID=UPI00343061B3